MCLRLLRRILLLAVLLAALTPPVALGQLSPQSLKIGSSERSTPTYTLDGVVLNSVTGEAVGAALVQINLQRQISVLTAFDGTFHFESLPSGQVTLSVRKPGFVNDDWQFTAEEQRSRTVQVGPNMQAVALKLVPEGLIYGRITDSDGEPVENLLVKLMYAGIVNGKKQWQQRAGAQTNEDGEFRLFGLTPGAYYLEAGPSFNSRLRSTGHAQEGFPVTYYPGVRDLDSAARITIVPGKQVRADLYVKPEIFYKVSGTVTPPSAVNITFLNSEGEPVPSAIQADPSGNFIARSVPVGSYVIRAYAQGKGSQGSVASLPVKVNSEIADLHLVLSPTATIPVAVRYELMRKSDLESFPKDMQPVNIQLRQAGNRLAAQESWASTEGPPENRSFAVRNVEAGTYEARITSIGPWYVESAQCGGTDLLTQVLTVGSGGMGQPIGVVLRDDFATLDGTVSLAEHRAPGTVLLIPELNPEAAVTVPVDSTGQFRAERLPPGDYRAFAFSRIDGLEYANAEVMRTYSSGEQLVRLIPNGRSTVNLTVQDLRK